MHSALPGALLYTLIPVAAALVAGAIAAFKPPGARATSAIQHFAAGVVFSAAATELLPKVIDASPIVIIIGFAAGIGVMLTLRVVSDSIERSSRRQGKKVPVSLIGVTGADFLVDGVVLGAGFAAGGRTGVLLSIALAMEYLFVGISVATEVSVGAPRWRVIGTPFVISLLTLVGAGAGTTLLDGASEAVLATMFAFGAVVFMYLVTEELLVQAHQKGETTWGTSLFFIGFALYLLIERIA